MSLAEAIKVFDKLIASKLAKGYRALGGSFTPYRQIDDAGRDSGIRCQLLNPVDVSEVSRLLTGTSHCMQEKHDGRRLLVRKQGDEITGINRRGLFVAIPEPIRQAVEQIPYDVLIDGEAVGETLHAFDLLEVKGNDLRQRRYLDRHSGLIMAIPPSLPALRWVSTAVDPSDKLANRGHPELPPVVRFRTRFDANSSGVDYIGGEWFALGDSKTPLATGTVPMIGRLPVPSERLPNGRVPDIDDLLIELIEDHLDYRHPEWTSGEGSYGLVSIRLHPQPRISGHVTRRFISTKTYRV